MHWAGGAATTVHAATVLGPPGAPEVVGVPGLGCSHRYFRPLARALAPYATTVVPDLPGFGRSTGPRRSPPAGPSRPMAHLHVPSVQMCHRAGTRRAGTGRAGTGRAGSERAGSGQGGSERAGSAAVLDVPGLADALAAWLHATDRAGAVLVANSLGCQVVLDLAARHPDLAGPLVLVGPAVDPRGPGTARHVLRLAVDGLREDPRLVALIAADYLLDAGLHRVLATFRHALRHRVDAVARRVLVPVVVVRGAGDPVAPAGWARVLAALVPRGRCVEVPGQAHAVHHSDPAAVVALVRPLLGSRSSTGAGDRAAVDPPRHG